MVCYRLALETDAGLMLVFLPGHTKGHCVVAIQRDGTWLWHAGDAILNRLKIDSALMQPALAG